MTLPKAPDSPRASIVIRTYNEGRHLAGVLNRIARQSERSFEVIVVDSGSTDNTREIAELSGARIEHIAKADFTFGRSLNVGCRAARGEFLVFVSGHCYPMDEHWLANLLRPFEDGRIGLSYGKQRGGKTTKFSEHRVFARWFPAKSEIPQHGHFCNNANCAIRRSLWEVRAFNETLTGLEDLDWARWMVAEGKLAAYVAEAGVHHIHNETWPQVFRRYEREAIAMQQIHREISMSLAEAVRLFVHSSILDLRAAARRRKLLEKADEIIKFRFSQYFGTWRGERLHRMVSQRLKEKFYYPVK